jgi:glutamate-1-semialdehyde 2,1-aminomutase
MIGGPREGWTAGLSVNAITRDPEAADDHVVAVGVTPVTALGLVLCLLIAAVIARRVVTALWTLRALAWMPALSRRLARWVKPRSYSDEQFFRADGAEEPWLTRRQAAIDRLAGFFRARHSRAMAWSDTTRESFSDLRFTDANRLPFPFAQFMRERFNLCSVVTASDGPRLLDVDGQWTLDLSGSYGVNVAGYARYKQWMARGLERVQELGPVLGPLHPLVAENIARLRSISNLDEVSFHMSGTEAVMAAVRLARFNTRRKFIVSFAGAYHGWWDGVQPGLGSERALDDCLTLKDLHPASLAVIRRRAREIAGVLVNPVQAFHPNAPPPNDAVLLTSGARRTATAGGQYSQWLRELRALCHEYDIPLIFDEVYSGFRLAPGGAQTYFGVQADMVVYGKTVAGGMPIGVVCGRAALMRRFDAERPLRIAYVLGTFSAHPVVMGTMNEFLRWVVEPSTAELYDEMNERCQRWVERTNRELMEAALPVRLVNLATVWTVLFTEPGRYNWLFQYYLRAEGMTLSWVGTGRCLSSMDFTEKDYEALRARLVDAARKMKADGWWLGADEHPRREQTMRARLIREVLGSLVRVPRSLQSFFAEVMRRKTHDHHASHSNTVNQLLHIVSSSAFLVCYAMAFWDLTTAMWAGLAALFLRQIGHAVLEPPCHDKEATLLGYNTRSKTLILGVYLLIPAVRLAQASAWTGEVLRPLAAAVAQELFLWTLVVVVGRVVYLIWAHDLRLALVWFVKLITDPATDLIAYAPRFLGASTTFRWSRSEPSRQP